MDSASDQLQQLGFSQYEAKAYISLLQRNPLNGYELAKLSGIPRPNVYSVLDKLQEKGAVVRLDTPEGTRYAPIPSEELIQRLRGQYMASLEAANHSLNEVCTQSEQQYIWNIHGYPVVLEHAQAVIHTAREHLLIAAWPEEITSLQSCLHQQEERGIQISTLCLAGCPKVCEACQGNVFRLPVYPKKHSRWLLIVSDHEEVLAGEIDSETETIAVRTHQKLLVELASGYIRNSITFSSVFENNQGDLRSAFSKDTLTSLASLDPESTQDEWLAYMRHMLYPS